MILRGASIAWDLEMRLLLSLIFALLMIACSPIDSDNMPDMTLSKSPAGNQSERPASSILESFATAWRGDQEFALDRPITLGFWIDGEGYTIDLSDEGGAYAAGEPNHYDWGFKTDLGTLQRLDSGSINALTAMGQARGSDPSPLELRLPDDFSETDKIRGFYIPLTLHFWNREWPETIRFGDGLTRGVHGANTTVLIYDQGLRTAWYQLKSGMHINAEPADQINDFETAIVVTRGRFGGKIDGVERVFHEGETVLIPAGISHEFYADDGEYGEFIILMWGDNA